MEGSPTSYESKSRRDEVAIIGASASGLYTALLLAQEGVPVTVYERCANLEPAPRTLIVTSALRAYLGSMGDQAILSEVERYELCCFG